MEEEQVGPDLILFCYFHQILGSQISTQNNKKNCGCCRCGIGGIEGGDYKLQLLFAGEAGPECPGHVPEREGGHEEGNRGDAEEV